MPRGRNALLAICMLPVLASCGDDSSPGSDSTGDAATTTATTTTASSAQGNPTAGSGGDGGTAGTGGQGGAGTGGAGTGGGGGEPSALDDVYRSGTRLRARILDGGGDARAFVGWHDTDLEIDCYLIQADDDTMRCLPEQGFLVFLDDACTQPAIRRTGTCGGEVLPYISRYERTETGCNAPGTWSAYRAVGDEVEALELFAYDAASGCTPAGDGSARPAELVPLETFALGELVMDPIDGEMDRALESFEDGAYRAAHGQDLARGAACSRMDPAAGDGTDWCVPSYELRTDNYQYWADDACGEPVVTSSACGEGDTRLILDRLYDECGVSGVQLHERGTFFEGPLHETFGQDSECFAQPSLFAFRFGAAVAYGDFPELEARDFAGDGVVWRTPARAGRVIASAYPRHFYDAQGARCYPNDIDGTVARCLPGRVSYVDRDSLRYGDDACSVPLVAVGANDATCGVRRIAVERDGDACGQPLVGAYEIGAPHEGAVYELDDAAACVAVQPGTGVHATVELDVNVLDDLPLLVTRVE